MQLVEAVGIARGLAPPPIPVPLVVLASQHAPHGLTPSTLPVSAPPAAQPSTECPHPLLGAVELDPRRCGEPGEQLLAAAEVANLLVRHYGLEDVIGHDDIAPERKTDPGPAFPMAAFRARVMGRGDDTPSVVRAQVTTALNIRTGPGTGFEKLPASPLPAGTKVEILAQQGAWRQVLVLDVIDGDADIEGWVHSRYLA